MKGMKTLYFFEVTIGLKNETSELNKFFKNPVEPFAPIEQVQETEEIPEDLKNRHVRRLEAKVQAEREANIALAARVEALSEVSKLRQDTSVSSWEEKARRIYGNDKPENAVASDLLVDSIREATTRAKEEALEEARREYREQAQEEEKEVQTVNSYIEQIEDQFGVDFTSSQSAREKQQEFRDLWFRLSPKDSNGEVKEYADPFEVFEIFNSRTSNRAKDSSSRGMVRSQSVESKVSDDATTKYLRENGIIDPF